MGSFSTRLTVGSRPGRKETWEKIRPSTVISCRGFSPRAVFAFRSEERGGRGEKDIWRRAFLHRSGPPPPKFEIPQVGRGRKKIAKGIKRDRKGAGTAGEAVVAGGETGLAGRGEKKRNAEYALGTNAGDSPRFCPVIEGNKAERKRKKSYTTRGPWRGDCNCVTALSNLRSWK